jgi:hypothetical protein
MKPAKFLGSVLTFLGAGLFGLYVTRPRKE